jgi:hypothetical protein
MGDTMKLQMVLALGLLGSAVAAQAQQTVRVIDAEAAKKCVFVDTGITAGRGSSIEDVAEALRSRALAAAGAANGNAVVMRDLTASGTYPMLMFDIYRC